MKIYLRKKRNSNNKTSLFLEYYFGYSKDIKNKLKLKRKFEFLGIWIYTEAKNKKQREYNKELISKAELILKKKQVESLNDNFEFDSNLKPDINFIDYFTKALDRKSIKISSYQNYKNVLTHLIAYCNPDTTTFKDIDEGFIRGFKNHLDNIETARGIKLHINTKRQYYILVKSVISEALRNGYIPKNPFINIKNYSLQESKKEYLTLEELQKLNITDCNFDVIKRAFLFACLTGLRRSDVCNLKRNQIIKSKNTYKIEYRQRKTNHLEYLPINKQAYDLLRLAKNQDEKPFKGLMNTNTLNNTLVKWCLKAGINKPITFHSARHTFATMQLTAGTDIYTVSKLLGHKNLETTQIYAKIIDEKKQTAINNIPKLKIFL
jgi:integrase